MILKCALCHLDEDNNRLLFAVQAPPKAGCQPPCKACAATFLKVRTTSLPRLRLRNILGLVAYGWCCGRRPQETATTCNTIKTRDTQTCGSEPGTHQQHPRLWPLCAPQEGSLSSLAGLRRVHTCLRMAIFIETFRNSLS